MSKFHTTDYFCWGIHPWNIEEANFKKWEKQLGRLHQDRHFFAMGELGIDKVCKVPLEKQIISFENQINLAVKLNIKRIIIHCVKAFDEVYKIISEQKYQGTICFHQFSGNGRVFNQFNTKFKTYISIGMLNLKNEKSIKKIQNIPSHRVFLETDDKKGVCIRNVYSKYAKTIAIDEEKLKIDIWNNFAELMES